MIRKPKKQRNPVRYPLDAFLSGVTTFSEEFPHLQIFLHRQRENNSMQNFEFLMVTPTSFGKVEVLNLMMEGGFIIVEFLDCAMKKTGIVRINIHDNSSTVLFICWQDVRKMVMSDMTTNYCNDELLELEDD